MMLVVIRTCYCPRKTDFDGAKRTLQEESCHVHMSSVFFTLCIPRYKENIFDNELSKYTHLFFCRYYVEFLF